MVTRIISIVLFLVAIFLGYYLFNSVKSKIDEAKQVERVERNIIEKLKLIRDTQIAFQLVNGKYTASWDSLIQFLDKGVIYIIDRREEIIPKEYGDEEIIVHIDTVGTVPAKQYVFTELNIVAAPDSGQIVSINTKENDEVTINYQMFTMQTSEKLLKYRSQYNGQVVNVHVRPGQIVNKGANLFEILNYKYPMGTDISRLPFIPGTDNKFEIFASKIDRNGVMVDVFEVKDTDPVNPERRQNNNEKALRVGSRTEVSTSGNWE